MSAKSLLLSTSSSDPKAAEALDAARLLLDVWLGAYQAGEITFEKMCRFCFDALNVEHIADAERAKRLGAVVAFALVAPAPKRSTKSARGRALRLAEIAHGLVRLANQREGLPIVRARIEPGASTAYQRAAEIMQLRGIKIATAASVEKMRAKWIAHRKSR